MKTDLRELYQGAQTLFRAFCYLQPRMESAGTQPQPMNACMAKLMGEIRQHRTGSRMGLTV
jgi:hypothetical protein